MVLWAIILANGLFKLVFGQKRGFWEYNERISIVLRYWIAIVCTFSTNFC